MQLILNLDIPPIPTPINYPDKLLLVGSCFTEHISERLNQTKLDTLSNPHGILFNPLSVAHSLDSYTENKIYTENDLFFLNELWNSWNHHTRFSDVTKDAVLDKINTAQKQASAFIRTTDYIIITLGSAFQYYLKEKELPVANNHRAPAQWFEKKLLLVEEIVAALSQTFNKILEVNPNIKFIFTISPVRHIRDGVVNNNRSKARLIEATHILCGSFTQAYYFPAYELIIDILRDYRFFDIDFVHPNYMATQYVWEQFVKSCVSPQAKELMDTIREIIIARNHKTRFPETDAHKKFMMAHWDKINALVAQHPYLDMKEELVYFSA